MTAPTLSYRQLLRVPDMRALLLATCLSRMGGRMLSLAIVLYALAHAGSPDLAGWLAFAVMAPGLAISPIAGALIDRAVWAINADMIASAACVLALALVDLLGWASKPVLLLLTTLFSLTSPLSTAGIRTLLPRLVPREVLDRANALDTSIHGLTDIVGPALAGLLMGLLGAAPTFGVIAVLYAGAALCIGSIHCAYVRPGQSLHAALLREAWTGLVRVVRQPTLRGLAICYGLYQITWGALIVLVPVVAARHFGTETGESMARLLWAGAGAAGVIGALSVGRFGALGRERQVMAVGMVLTAVAAWPVAAKFGLAGLVVGLMLISVAAGPIDVGLLTLRQRRTDPAELGRVLSVSMSLNLAGIPVGSALAGVLATWSLTMTFAIAALASLLAAATVVLVPRQHASGPG